MIASPPASTSTVPSTRRARAQHKRTGASAQPSARQTASMRAAERDALLGQHLGLVHHVARQLAKRLSTAADLDELVSSGTIGLIQAAETFDGSRGLSFSTYAVPRIRGAILDDLRKQDLLPRNVRRRSKELARARDVLAGALRRAPTHDEVAHVMRVPAETIRRWELDAEGAAQFSLDQPLRGEESGVTLSDTLMDERTAGVDERLTHEREVERLKVAIAGMKEQERTVLALNFFEELKLQEIADVLGLSVCRISQIRTAALGKLRLILSDLRAA